MGTPEAGKVFLQALTGSGLGSTDLIEDSIFDTVALRTITDIRAYEGRLTCVIPVEPRVQNRYGTLHGGCIGQHSRILAPIQALRIASEVLHEVWRLADLRLQMHSLRHSWLQYQHTEDKALHCARGDGAATLVDVVGSAALVTVSERSGVSLNISVDYLRPGQAGEDVLVDARVGVVSACTQVISQT